MKIWSTLLVIYVSLFRQVHVVCVLRYLLSTGPLAQSVERRADNAKVVSSRLTWTTYSFFCLLLCFYFSPKSIWNSCF